MFITAEMSHEPEFDLGIVCTDDKAVLERRDEGLADFPAPFRADRYILEVRVVGRQSSGGRKRLVESRMYLSIAIACQSRQSVCVSGEKLLEIAVFEDFLYDRVGGSDRSQSTLVRRIASLWSFLDIGRYLQFLEQQFSHLLGRRKINLGITGKSLCLELNFVHLGCEGSAVILELGRINFHSGKLHLGQCPDKRHLDSPVEVPSFRRNSGDLFRELVFQVYIQDAFFSQGLVFCWILIIFLGKKIHLGGFFLFLCQILNIQTELLLKDEGRGMADLRINQIV